MSLGPSSRRWQSRIEDYYVRYVVLVSGKINEFCFCDCFVFVNPKNLKIHIRLSSTTYFILSFTFSFQLSVGFIQINLFFHRMFKDYSREDLIEHCYHLCWTLRLFKRSFPLDVLHIVFKHWFIFYLFFSVQVRICIIINVFTSLK